MSTVDHDVEKRAIQRAILDYYHEGHVRSDPRLYEEVFHPEWRFFFLDEGGDLCIVSREEYLSWYDPANADPELDWETEFYSIEITEGIASVKLRLECQRVRFIDYFNMMKLEGRWWIVHKMSHRVLKDN